MDEAELGRQLRATTERIAKAAAESVLAQTMGDLERMSDRLAKQGDALKAVNLDRLRNDYAEMMAAQTRLEAARGEILTDLGKARDGVAAAIEDGVSRVVGQLEEYLVHAVSDEVARVSPAARDELHKSVIAEIEATRAVCAAMIEAAEARIAIKLVPSTTLRDIRDARGHPARKP
jgi:chromosome segregation ATPase